jgi:nucleotide-binding universal stress UspA family protein
MERRILIPLDGSKVGEAALPYVQDLVSNMSPEVKVVVTLLQVLAPKTVPVVGGETSAPIAYTVDEMEQTKNQAMAYLERTGQALTGKGCKVISTVAIGDASEEIVLASKQINANLIAMSTHGRSGLSRWAFGSVTDKVLQRGGTVPIIMVRAPNKAEKA